MSQMSVQQKILKLLEKLWTYDFMRGIRLNVAEHDDHSFLKLTVKVRDKIVADGFKR